MHIPPYLGLEVEVGEIKGPGELTTVEEAQFFIGGLNSWGIFPDLLAISNGSLHGTYDTGQQEGIDLQRTQDIAHVIRPFGVSIAQHGISGTPIEKVAKFANFGINKGNVATLFQNIVFGRRHCSCRLFRGLFFYRTRSPKAGYAGESACNNN